MRLYSALVPLFRAVTRLYFAEVHVAGAHQLPARGPVILAANHPGSILDAVLLATQAARPIRFLARSGLFRWPLLATLCRQLGAIPIYRSRETRDHTRRNAETFARVYTLLEHGGCVGIFPEGRNSPHGRIGELRKGTARIALEAERRNGYRLDIAVVPAGIAFERRGFLMSAVVVRFGRPIRVGRMAARYRDEPEEAVLQLTGELQAALRRQASQAVDAHLQELAADLAEIHGQRLPPPSGDGAGLGEDAARRARGRSSPLFKRGRRALLRLYRRSAPRASRVFAARVRDRDRIALVLARGEAQEPATVAALRKQVERYQDHVGQVRLRRSLSLVLHSGARTRLLRLRMTAYAIAMAPVALFGLVHNLPPYLATAWSAAPFRDPPVRAFAQFGFGLVAFGATYGGLAAWLWQADVLSAPWLALYIASLPPTGIAALDYRRTLLVYRDRILLRTFFCKRGELVERLRRERAVILARLAAMAARHRVDPAGRRTDRSA